MIAEMIHTASLMHDDVIDAADTRRGKTSINQVWGQRKVCAFQVAKHTKIYLASMKCGGRERIGHFKICKICCSKLSSSQF